MNFPQIDPVIFSLGPLQVRWYGLMYVIGFLVAGQLFKKLIKRNFLKVTEEKIDTLIAISIACMFIGARFTYVFVYNWDYYSQNLSELLAVWKGGLSFHGALIGLIVAGVIFARQNKISWLQVMDSVALVGGPGLFFGRIGNFINGELWGRTTDSWVGVVFADAGPLPRHPSQLYEAFLEGVVLGVILWITLPRLKNYGILSCMFLWFWAVLSYLVMFIKKEGN